MPATSQRRRRRRGAQAGGQGRVAVEVDDGVAPSASAEDLADVEVAVDRQDDGARGAVEAAVSTARCASGARVSSAWESGSCDSVSRTARSRAPTASSAAAAPAPGSAVPAGRRRGRGASARRPRRGRLRTGAGARVSTPSARPRLGDRPGPAVLGAREVGLRRPRPAPSDRCRARATRRVPHQGRRLGEPGGRQPAQPLGGRVRPDQRLGHPLHDDPLADDPRTRGSGRPPSPLVSAVDGDRRLRPR